MLSWLSHVQLFVNLWTVARQIPLSMGRVAMPSSRGSCRPRDQTCISYIFYIGRQVLYYQCHLGSPKHFHRLPQNCSDRKRELIPDITCLMKPRLSLGNVTNDVVPHVEFGTQSAGISERSADWLPIWTHSWTNSSDIIFLPTLFW